MYSPPAGGQEEDHTQPYGLGPDDGSDRQLGSTHYSTKARPGSGRHSRMTRWVAGLGLAALVVGGGSVLGYQLAAGGSASTVGTAFTSNGSPAGGSPAAALTAVLGSPASTSATAFTGRAANASPAGAVAALRRCAKAARHLRAIGHRKAARALWRSCVQRFLRHVQARLRGLHGTITVKTKHGVRTIAFERGVIQSDSGTAIVVKAADGTTFTWDLISKTAVFRAGHRSTAKALATGERVFVVGPVRGGADDARLILIRR